MSLLDTLSSSEPGTETAGNESSSSAADSSSASSAAGCEARSRSVPQCSLVSEKSEPASSSMLEPLTRDELRSKLRVTSGQTQECNTCHVVLPIEVFAKLKGTRFRNPRCSACRNKRQMGTPSVRAKMALLNELKAQPCVDCGGRFPSECMDFDHLDHDAKKYNVATSWRWISIERLKEEISKCELVCANCHRTRTRKRGYTGGLKSKFLAEVQRDAAEVPSVSRSAEVTTERL